MISAPRSFSAAGNLNGITARLDELKDLGVDVLWLMPNYVEARINLGTALFKLGRVPEAIEHLQQALWLKPGVHPAAQVLATGDGQTLAVATSLGQGRGFALLLGLNNAARWGMGDLSRRWLTLPLVPVGASLTAVTWTVRVLGVGSRSMRISKFSGSRVMHRSGQSSWQTSQYLQK